jgi:hypothetical protein
VPKRFAILGVSGVVVLVVALVVVFASGNGARNVRLDAAHLLLKNAMSPGRMDHFVHGREAVRDANDGPAQEAYANRAYPFNYVGFAQQQATFRDARKLLKHNGGRLPKPWEAIGPSTLNVDTFGTQTYGPPTQWSGRVSALAVAPTCSTKSCPVYLAAAGGGIWMARNGLAATPDWRQISDSGIGSNAIGALLIDPTDPSGRTIYAGTGEPNGSSDSEAGIGLFKSTDGGNSWSLVPGSVAVAHDRSIGAIAIDPANPSHILIGTDVARHGLSSEYGGRMTPPGAPPVGLYQSTDGGASFAPALIEPQDVVDPASANGGDFFLGGVTQIGYDPTHAGRLYLAMFGYGLFRSSDNGTTFENIFQDQLGPNPGANVVRYAFATAALPNGKTRIYLGSGDNETTDSNGNVIDGSKLYRTDDASQSAATLTAGGNGGWLLLSSSVPGTPGFGSFDFCEAQCSYDIFVGSPAGQPDTVVLGGSMHYGELPLYPGPDASNGRAVIQSTDGGVNWTDLTGDAATQSSGLLFHNEDMHPDQHALAFDPANPDIMFVGSDGGIIRTSGAYANNSAACDSRGLSGADLQDCHQWLSRIPTKLTTMNAGLNTLQFQSLSVNPNNPLADLLGGTQDNGTLAYTGSSTWFLPVTGDGGDSGIDAVNGNVRFHTYTSAQVDVNFHGNKPETWDWIGDPLLFSGEAAAFYAPMIADPVTGGQMFAGEQHVWRTQDSGGSQTFLDNHCNTTGVFGTSDQLFTGNCGDWVPIGSDLTAAALGSKAGGWVAELTRATDKHTLWAATRRGRIFISQNADASDPNNVSFTRIDTTAQPTRFPSGISVDPTNPFHAIVTYSGYNAYAAAAGTAPGHVFEVLYDPTTHTATWKNLDHDLGDQPILDAAYDQATGDIYVSTDFGVDRLPAGATSWIPAADGMPPVAVYGLTLADGGKTGRVLYAATHGRGAYRIMLPKAKK